MTVHLNIYYNIHVRGDRESMREAINWLFDNCTDGWTMDQIIDIDPQEHGWASFQVEFSTDRDAVLFKTFWDGRE